MTAPTQDRSGFIDLIAQLRRRWAVVGGGALLGLVVGISLVQAFVPAPAPESERLVVVLVATLVGLLAGFVGALVLVSLLPRVTTVDDVRRVTGLPVVAQLPTAALDSDDFTSSASSSRLRTSLREAVLNIRALAGGDLPERIVIARTDVVTEACGVDGGLARALVESGYVPALVQSDFESRMLVRPSTVDPSGFAEVAKQDPAGYQHIPVTDRVTSARARDRVSRVDDYLDSLSERYDVTLAQVASDSTPVPLRSIAPVASVVLIVVRSNRTTVESLVALYAELVALDVTPLGVVMTGVAARHRVLLRRTWSPTDFRSGDRAKAVASGKVAGFSIADLASSTFAEPLGSFDSLDRLPPLDRKDFS